MNFLGNKYYKLNRHLLLLVGLWPYVHSLFRYCQIIFCNIIVAFLMVFQIAKLLTLKQDVNLMLKLLPPILPCLICIIKHQTFCIVAKKMRYLMDHVEQDWNMLKNKKELEIIERYTYIGSMCTLALTIVGLVAILIIMFLPFVPIVLDIFMPLNYSRPRQLLFPVEYFIDQQKYFYVICLHFNITASLVLITLVGTESLYITYILHVCGMFQIASYRLHQAFDNKLLQNCTLEKQSVIVCKGIIEAIHIHKRALEFSEFLWSTLSVSYSILLIIGITSFLINLFCLLQTVLFIKEIKDIILLIGFNFGHFVYLFLGNYVGQILIDHSSSIFENTYITRWYDASLQAQKLLPIIMQRSMKSCKMVINGMYVSSFEGFATLMSTTLSYFTVIWSVQN
ncbi:odorant receptor 49a-like [Camponotus floridanus]|uniref:odorant receptor 49a-like n=1 Tax=Camponotus floridanus TaxID=104421 RepID=UPI000DC68BC9|nr:odorant receptor 49a-like [Camponotus floridanus]